MCRVCTARSDLVELAEQAALADARLAQEKQDSAGTPQRSFDGFSCLRELPLATDKSRLQSGQAPLSRDIRDRTNGREGLDGRRLAFQLESLRFAPLEPRVDETLRVRADEHAARIRGALQPCGGVDGVAKRRVLHARAGADRAERDRSGVDADADREPIRPPRLRNLLPVGGDLVRDPQSSADRTLGIVLVRRRSSEEREYAVTGEILHRAAVVLDRVDDPRDGFADDELDVLRVELLAECGRSLQIGEQRGHDLAFLAHHDQF